VAGRSWHNMRAWSGKSPLLRPLPLLSAAGAEKSATKPAGSNSSDFSQTDPEWTDRHMAYWNSLAIRYDREYSDPWSQYENGLVKRRIANLLPQSLDNLQVIEFGCGTGLGYTFMADLTSPKLQYTGIDLSSEMLSIFRERRASSSLKLLNSPLEAFTSSSFTDIDIVIGIFTSASYVNLDLPALLALIGSWIKPCTGSMYISFLNRTSLHGILKWGTKARIEYSSRGLNSDVIPARRYTKSELLRACEALGLAGKVYSLGPLAGLYQAPILWGLNAAMHESTLFTHTIDLMAKRIE
jgi:SAM-dependent methyltransferase